MTGADLAEEVISKQPKIAVPHFKKQAGHVIHEGRLYVVSAVHKGLVPFWTQGFLDDSRLVGARPQVHNRVRVRQTVAVCCTQALCRDHLNKGGNSLQGLAAATA